MTPDQLRRENEKRKRKLEAYAGVITCIVTIGSIFLYLASI